MSKFEGIRENGTPLTEPHFYHCLVFPVQLILYYGKRYILAYWEISGYPDCSQMSGPVVSMENYTFLESEGFPLSKNI